MEKLLYKELANLIDARSTCDAHGNAEWFDKHTETIAQLVKTHLPHGSGFDSGTTLDLLESHANKLVFQTSFHHMDSESGMYDGWTEHTVTVTPSLGRGFNLRISGSNRNDIKDYIHDIFSDALQTALSV